jgi:hypothetical protein
VCAIAEGLTVSPLEYIFASLDGWDQYVLLATLFLVLHWILVRRWVVGIYDPLFLILIANAFGWAIVYFMYLRGDIATVYALSFTVTQIALYVGIGLGRVFRPRVLPPPASADSLAVPQLTLTMAALVHIASTLSIWALAGVPLFRASRLGAFVGSGGLGGLERLAESSALIAAFAVLYLMLLWPRLRRSPLIMAYVAWYLLTVALSGSKGALMTVGQYALVMLFVYGGLRYHASRFWGGRAGKILVVAAIAFALAVLVTQQESDLGSAMLALVYRVVNYGDVYIYAYPDATIEEIRGDNPLVGLFGGFLSTFRLFPPELLHTNIGFQFTGLVYPDLEIYSGPNPQHSVFGYHYFGPFAFIFSFLLGILTSISQATLFNNAHRSFLSGLVAFMFYFAMVNISVDFDYSMAKLATMVIGLVVIVGPVLVLLPGATIVRRGRRMEASGVGSWRAP